MGYDLDQFFRVKTQIELPRGITVYMRVLSDWETRQRTEAAIVASAQKRRELRDPESIAHATYIESIKWASEDDLRNTILALERRNITREAFDETEVPYIPFPDDASLEERQDVVDRREEAEKDSDKRRQKTIDAKVKSLSKALAKRKKAYLVKRCQTAQIDAQSVVTYVDEFNRQTLFHSCFKDEARKERLFESPDDANALPSLIYDKLLAEYTTIDRAQTRDLVDFFGMATPS